MNLEELNPKDIFSKKADNYSKYRPDYPKEIINFLCQNIGLTQRSIIADIGSGTGISSKMFLENDNVVFGIEPNKEMRLTAEKYLSRYKNFHSIVGSSEDTKLSDASIDIIISGQAFHWFEPEPTKKEFLRILKTEGVVVIFNNRRKVSDDKFMNRYRDLVKKYSQNTENTTKREDTFNFFYPSEVNKATFYNPQQFDLERLKGELLSYSNMPNEEDGVYDMMMVEIEDLWEQFNINGNITLEYETQLLYGKIK